MTRLKADLILLAITLVWGGTFVTMKSALGSVAPINLVAWRFLIAASFLFAFFRKKPIFKGKKIDWLMGAAIGIFLGLGYITQTIGLQTTTAGKAGFLTGACVLLVPIFSTIFAKKPPSLWVAAGILLAFVGLGFLSLQGDFTLATGDLWVLLCAVFFAFQVFMLGHFGQGKWNLDSRILATAQVSVAAIVATMGAVALEGVQWKLPISAWILIASMGLFATAILFVAQSYAQKFTTPTHAALIFMAEPVFAAFFGWLVSGEQFTSREWLGSGLVLAGMFLGELPSIRASMRRDPASQGQPHSI